MLSSLAVGTVLCKTEGVEFARVLMRVERPDTHPTNHRPPLGVISELRSTKIDVFVSDRMLNMYFIDVGRNSISILASVEDFVEFKML